VYVTNDFPAALAATPFRSCIEEDELLVEPDTVSETVATTPFESGIAFIPHNMHVVEPVRLLQVRDLFVPPEAGPAATTAAEKSAAG
jgi:hypothetical protein